MFMKLFHWPALAMSNYAVIVLHVGTNDIEKFPIEQSKVSFEVLISFVKLVAPNAHLIDSTIIPRPRDFETLGEKVNELNYWLMNVLPGITVLKSFSSFLHQGKLIKELFWKDGLHLAQEGITLFRDRLATATEDSRGYPNLTQVAQPFFIAPLSLVCQRGAPVTFNAATSLYQPTPFLVRGYSNPCSNFWESPFHINNYQYVSAEHAYQAAKAEFHREKRTFFRILAARHATDAKSLGAPIHRRCPAQCPWENRKTHILADIVRAKMAQCPECRCWLLSSKDREIIHNVQDTLWGINRAGMGRNLFGVILMQIRREIAYRDGTLIAPLL
jgi:ribA/ribD-fused uncharacterized protein